MAKLRRLSSSRHSGHGSADAIDDTALAQTETFETFGCKVPQTNPDTPEFISAREAKKRGLTLVEYERDFTSGSLRMPDGRDIEIWTFEDPRQGGGLQFPAPPMVFHQGDLAHVTVHASKGPHTIHHHAIEPTAMNDGVGHTSFEVSGSYTYQYRVSQPGTYLYHCHVNTVLHFEMGMYGALIVYPPRGKDRTADGRRLAYTRRYVPDFDNPAIVVDEAYDVERFLAVDDFDPRWHELNHAAGLCGEDEGLNNFNPKYFLVNGVAQKNGLVLNPEPLALQTQRLSSPLITDPEVAVNASVGQRVLLRMAQASYAVLVVQVPHDLDVYTVERDGRQLGGPASPYSGPVLTSGFQVGLATGQRAAVIVSERAESLLRPSPRTYVFEGTFVHWISGRPLGFVRVPVTFS